jgi:hypothetical protein
MPHKKDSDFMIDIYIPQVNKVVIEKNLSISILQKLNILKKFIGMIMKIGYAFLW